MGFIVREQGESSFPVVEAGLHQAVCYALYDLGTHYSEKFDKSSRKVLIIWELPELRIDIEKDGVKQNLPRVVSKKYTLSLGEKANLRKDLSSWRGRVFTPQELEGFDLQSILGVNCMIQIIHNTKDGKTYANISNILPLLKNMPSKKPENPVVCFSLEENPILPEHTPKWIKELIMSSKELSGGVPFDVAEDVPINMPDDSVPF